MALYRMLQTEIHTAEPLESDSIAFDVEMSTKTEKETFQPVLIKSQQN
jgi:hypothetical protein